MTRGRPRVPCALRRQARTGCPCDTCLILNREKVRRQRRAERIPKVMARLGVDETEAARWIDTGIDLRVLPRPRRYTRLLPRRRAA